SIFEGRLNEICAAAKQSGEKGLNTLGKVANELCKDAGKMNWDRFFVETPDLQRYLLTKISRHLKLDGPTYEPLPTVEVEHVLPQSRPASYLGHLNKEEYDAIVSHIGNLTLLTDKDNAMCSNKTVPEKLPTYRTYKPTGQKQPSITG